MDLFNVTKFSDCPHSAPSNNWNFKVIKSGKYFYDEKSSRIFDVGWEGKSYVQSGSSSFIYFILWWCWSVSDDNLWDVKIFGTRLKCWVEMFKNKKFLELWCYLEFENKSCHMLDALTHILWLLFWYHSILQSKRTIKSQQQLLKWLWSFSFLYGRWWYDDTKTRQREKD